MFQLERTFAARLNNAWNSKIILIQVSKSMQNLSKKTLKVPVFDLLLFLR